MAKQVKNLPSEGAPLVSKTGVLDRQLIDTLQSLIDAVREQQAITVDHEARISDLEP